MKDGRPVILQVLPSLGSGGVERGTVDITRAITEADGHALVASSGGRMVADIAAAGGTHLTLPLASKNPLHILSNANALADLVTRHGVDVVHARSRAPGWSAYMAAKRCNIPLVTTFHGTYGIKGIGKKHYNAVMTKGERVIAVSEYIAQHVMTTYAVPQERIRVIARGVDLARFSNDAVLPQKIRRLIDEWRLQEVDAPLLFMPGRFTRWKGQHIVLAALAKLPHRRFFCVFAGDQERHPRYYQELQQLTKQLDLSAQVRFVPPTSDMTEAYSLSHCVLCPSIEPEAFGRIPIEAQAMERPVISSRHGGACETIRDGYTGWLVEPSNVEMLSQRIALALEMTPQQRQSFGERARQHAAERFSLAQMQSRTLDVYEEVISAAKP